MKVKFIKVVVTPLDKAGKVGQIKEFDKKTAEWLIEHGYAVQVQEPDTDKNPAK